MSPNINIRWLIGSIMLFMLPVIINAQEQDREQVLLVDIDSLVTRAVRDRIITKEESQELIGFVRDSLPEGTDLKIRALEQIRNELDDRYAEMVRNSMKLLDEAGYIGSRMLPDQLYEPEGYESPQEKRHAMEMAAVAGAAIDIEEMMKHVKPLKMKPWLLTSLRLLFGRGVSQRPRRWDYYSVPQMGGVYDIIMPGGQPDDSWRDAPPMYYDPHPDKHFRR